MYEMKTAADVLQMLGTDRERGLTRSEAMERKAKYGANKLKDQEQKSVGQMILEQLNDPLILILVALSQILVLRLMMERIIMAGEASMYGASSMAKRILFTRRVLRPLVKRLPRMRYSRRLVKVLLSKGYLPCMITQ